MVCRFVMCGYLIFGLRISPVVKFPWMSAYGIYFCRIIIKQQLITSEICRTCPETCRIYAAEMSPCFNYTSVTIQLLTERKKIPLGSSSALSPTHIRRPATLEHPLFLPAHTPWHHCLRLLQPFLC